MGRTPISEPCLFCLKLGLIPNLYMIFGIRGFFVYLCKCNIILML